MPDRFLPAQANARAGFYMVVAMAFFVCNDTLVKYVGATLPVGELVVLRGIVASSLILLMAARQKVLAALPQVASRPVLIRAAFDVAATLLFIIVLIHMGIANLTAIMQAVPLAVVLLSALLMGERVGFHRSAAIAAGFIGVLMIVKPLPSSFTRYDLIALLIVACVAGRDLMTRKIPTRIPSSIVALVNAVFVMLGGAVLSLFEGYAWPEGWQLLVIAAAAFFLAGGYTMIVLTLRTGDITASAPFRYSVLVFAIISGILVFGEYPDGWALLGMALIVAAGLYSARREAARQR
ncbi:DMT family transporter [Aestuariivirga sp.]|uniref:DMT family transporter n=1 Tax=Aestuariivirga sp. TaxID=2650926 RepID=UPI0039E270D6